jgi:hypothetical protein
MCVYMCVHVYTHIADIECTLGKLIAAAWMGERGGGSSARDAQNDWGGMRGLFGVWGLGCRV